MAQDRDLPGAHGSREGPGLRGCFWQRGTVLHHVRPCPRPGLEPRSFPGRATALARQTNSLRTRPHQWMCSETLPLHPDPGPSRRLSVAARQHRSPTPTRRAGAGLRPPQDPHHREPNPVARHAAADPPDADPYSSPRILHPAPREVSDLLREIRLAIRVHSRPKRTTTGRAH